MTRCMDMGNLHGRMVECTMDNITMGTRKALVYSNGQMEKATKGNGVMGRCMVQGSSKTHVITRKREFGKTESESLGFK